MEIVKLRGHHLTSLLEFINWQFGFSDMNLPEEDEKYSDEYGKEFIRNKHRSFQELLQRPETRILIVEEEFDFLCNGDCRSRDPECVSKTGYDRYIAQTLGFIVGQTYRVNEIINRVTRDRAQTIYS